MIAIRLQRLGRTHLPIFNIVAIDSRSRRDGRFLQKLGWYSPVAKEGEQLKSVNTADIKKFLDKGAQLSDTVGTLLKKHRISLT